ncbi:MAG TPA: type I-E CRISPR-associated protein Cse1/CasA [Chitinispirillaceae bacterium]|nr:type I-E CRISPR-associated protein Cse1/CasA [Chitinispirillaceae bacterium]
MNLLKDTWLPVIRQNGSLGEPEKIAIWQLLDDYNSNPVTDIVAYRPDFRNAIYQLLIGIVQVTALPEDEEHWSDLYHKPWAPQEFKEKVLRFEHCFEIDSAGPAFMQDFGPIEGFKEETLGNLFINLPANEHYMVADAAKHEKGAPQQINPYWAAVALHTLQTFAPSGGRGHRVGLRGGGPLTTILIPDGDGCSLWHKIWLNIICEDTIPQLTGDISKADISDMFPWMKPTKISENGDQLFAEECHPFHMYFGMPRRIRLVFHDTPGECDLTGIQSSKMVKKYLTRHSGNNYNGVWQHPLNAYGFDPKKPDEPPYSKKPTAGGITYRYWATLACRAENVIPAFIIKLSQESAYRRAVIKEQGATVWAAGYNMNNMKAECWYDATMPVYPFDPKTAEQVSAFIQELISATQDIANSVKMKVKNAWFNSPKDAKGDMSFVESAFWQNTEPDFYNLLRELSENPESAVLKNKLVEQWMVILSVQAYKLFEQWAMAQQEDGLDMKRVIKARIDLDKSVGKTKKQLKKMISSVE